jgi:hypothetical protein
MSYNSPDFERKRNSMQDSSLQVGWQVSPSQAQIDIVQRYASVRRLSTSAVGAVGTLPYLPLFVRWGTTFKKGDSNDIPAPALRLSTPIAGAICQWYNPPGRLSIATCFC